VEEGDVIVAFVLPGLRDRVERQFSRRGGLTFAADESEKAERKTRRA
jgi:hypothetical protein